MSDAAEPYITRVVYSEGVSTLAFCVSLMASDRSPCTRHGPDHRQDAGAKGLGQSVPSINDGGQFEGENAAVEPQVSGGSRLVPHLRPVH